MDKMLDSGSDDGGSSPFGCTKFYFTKMNQKPRGSETLLVLFRLYEAFMLQFELVLQ